MDGINKTGLGIVHQLNNTDKLIKKYLEELSSGQRINEAADDPAGLVVSEKMKAQLGGYLQELANIQDNISRLQTYEGTAASVQEAVGRMEELAVQAGNAAYTNEERSAIQEEIDSLNESITSFSQTTYNEQPIAGNLAPEAIGTASINVVDNPMAAAAQAQEAGNQVASLRAEAGAQINSLENQINSLAVAAENTMAAESLIRDADYAESIMNLVQEQIRERTGVAMLAQFNVQQASLLKLLE